MRRWMPLLFLVFLQCGTLYTKAGDSCSESGELVCGEPTSIMGMLPAVKILHCVSSAYTEVGKCVQSCDHVTGVRTAVGCGDKTNRAVANARCDAKGAACSMDGTQVLNCTNSVWTPIQTCSQSRCVLKMSGLIGCE